MDLSYQHRAGREPREGCPAPARVGCHAVGRRVAVETLAPRWALWQRRGLAPTVIRGLSGRIAPGP
jgi:hypothetical protein